MPQYEYECGNCRAVITQFRMSMCRRNPCTCPNCGASMNFRFAAGVQIIGQPTHLRDENRNWLGNSEAERTATRKQDDKDYERTYAKTGSGATRAKDL